MIIFIFSSVNCYLRLGSAARFWSIPSDVEVSYEEA